MKSVIPSVKGVIAIDGKQARRTADARKRPLHVVSAFAHGFGLVIGQLACEEKSNEITAIPQLLEMLDINGCIVTIDAMGTQTEIAKKIREKNADYILSLKSNQPTMYNDVNLFMDEYCKDEEASVLRICRCYGIRKRLVLLRLNQLCGNCLPVMKKKKSV